jgi:hypothetical protein
MLIFIYDLFNDAFSSSDYAGMFLPFVDLFMVLRFTATGASLCEAHTKVCRRISMPDGR